MLDLIIFGCNLASDAVAAESTTLSQVCVKVIDVALRSLRDHLTHLRSVVRLKQC